MLISVVVPVHNEEGNLEPLLDALFPQFGDHDVEVIFVDDGSTDSSLIVLEDLARRIPQVRFVSFSRNFGQQAALRAGLAESKGDAVISMDADLQHPPALIPTLLARWQEGYEVVYTTRDDSAARIPYLKRISSRAFYRTFKFLTEINIPPSASDFRLLDRKIVDLINAEQESSLFLRGYIQWLGFRQVGVPFVPDARLSGSTSYSIKRMVTLAGSGITQFSIRPLRLGYTLAFVAFLAALAYGIYAVVVTVSGDAVPGWLSTVILIILLQGLQFGLIGLIGEYLGRTFMQTKNRPEYVIARKS